MRDCGHPDCGVSTGICGSLTFGRGELDKNGYWEEPCYICARAAEKKFPEEGRCWPFEEDKRISSDEVHDFDSLARYIRNHPEMELGNEMFESDFVRDLVLDMGGSVWGCEKCSEVSSPNCSCIHEPDNPRVSLNIGNKITIKRGDEELQGVVTGTVVHKSLDGSSKFFSSIELANGEYLEIPDEPQSAEVTITL
jgi:hypothetical protein